MDDFELESLRVPQVRVGNVKAPATKLKGLASRWVDGEFIRGRWSMAWLASVCKLPKRAIQTALAILFEASRRNRTTDLKLTNAIVARVGIKRWSKSRALDDLERAGLISVDRRDNASPVVTILDDRADDKRPGISAADPA